MTDTEILDWMEANHPVLMYANHKIYIELCCKDADCKDTIRKLIKKAAARKQLPSLLDDFTT